MSNSLSNRPQNQQPNQLWKGWRLSSDLRETEYMNNPSICSNSSCKKELSYKKRMNKYCSNSCSATSNNCTRVCNIPPGPKKTKFPSSRVTFKKCSVCNKAYRLTINSHKNQCSYNCFIKNTTSIKQYRQYCKFSLNKNDHSCLFDIDLINLFGWYSPANKENNLKGVSWDHLYRISDGWKNNIPPEIMRHPANAELIPHEVNFARKVSQISYDELLERIKLWDMGCRTLDNFYIKNGK